MFDADVLAGLCRLAAAFSCGFWVRDAGDVAGAASTVLAVRIAGVLAVACVQLAALATAGCAGAPVVVWGRGSGQLSHRRMPGNASFARSGLAVERNAEAVVVGVERIPLSRASLRLDVEDAVGEGDALQSGGSQ